MFCSTSTPPCLKGGSHVKTDYDETNNDANGGKVLSHAVRFNADERRRRRIGANTGRRTSHLIGFLAITIFFKEKNKSIPNGRLYFILEVGDWKLEVRNHH